MEEKKIKVDEDVGDERLPRFVPDRAYEDARLHHLRTWSVSETMTYDHALLHGRDPWLRRKMRENMMDYAREAVKELSASTTK